MSLALTQFVQRPSFGHQGNKTKVRANFFEVVNFPHADFHHYDVNIDPPSTPVALYKRIWATLCENKDNAISAVFDGKKNCFSIVPLALNDKGEKTFEVRLQMITMIKAYKASQLVSFLRSWFLVKDHVVEGVLSVCV